MKISNRVKQIQPSATLALSAKAKEMSAAGIDVINLGIGEPDFNTPQQIKQRQLQPLKLENRIFILQQRVFPH